MTDARNQLHDCFLLHSRQYRESSLLLEIFSRDHGRVSLVAKAARNPRSRYYGNLQLFTPLLASWSGKGELHNLTALETAGPCTTLSGKRVLSGYYVNELIMRLLTRHDPHDFLYDVYESTLQALQQHDEEAVLRRFERLLLQETGYGLNLEYDTVNDQPVIAECQYHYDIEQGPTIVSDADREDLIISGETLISLANDSLTTGETRRQAKQLMRRIIDVHLGNKPLQTRSFYWYKNEQTG